MRMADSETCPVCQTKASGGLCERCSPELRPDESSRLLLPQNSDSQDAKHVESPAAHNTPLRIRIDDSVDGDENTAPQPRTLKKYFFLTERRYHAEKVDDSPSAFFGPLRRLNQACDGTKTKVKVIRECANGELELVDDVRAETDKFILEGERLLDPNSQPRSYRAPEAANKKPGPAAQVESYMFFWSGSEECQEDKIDPNDCRSLALPIRHLLEAAIGNRKMELLIRQNSGGSLEPIRDHHREILVLTEILERSQPVQAAAAAAAAKPAKRARRLRKKPIDTASLQKAKEYVRVHPNLPAFRRKGCVYKKEIERLTLPQALRDHMIANTKQGFRAQDKRDEAIGREYMEFAKSCDTILRSEPKFDFSFVKWEKPAYDEEAMNRDKGEEMDREDAGNIAQSDDEGQQSDGEHSDNGGQVELEFDTDEEIDEVSALRPKRKRSASDVGGRESKQRKRKGDDTDTD